MEGFGERLKSAVGDKPAREIAALIGCSERVLYNWYSEKSFPDASLLAQICRTLNIRADWLLHGHAQPERPSQCLDRDYVHLPLYDIEVAAGDGIELGNEDVEATLAFRKAWLHKEGLNAHHLILLHAAGDSMEPSIRDGDVLLVDRSQTTPKSEKIFVVRIGSEGFVKRLRIENGHVSLISDNRFYQPFERPARDVHVIGRVVWFGRKLL